MIEMINIFQFSKKNILKSKEDKLFPYKKKKLINFKFKNNFKKNLLLNKKLTMLIVNLTYPLGKMT